MGLDDIRKIIMFPIEVKSDLEEFKNGQINSNDIYKRIIGSFVTTILVMVGLSVTLFGVFTQTININDEIRANQPIEELAVINTEKKKFEECTFECGKAKLQIKTPDKYDCIYDLVEFTDTNNLAVVNIKKKCFEEFSSTIDGNTKVLIPKLEGYPIDKLGFSKKNICNGTFETIEFNKDSLGEWETKDNDRFGDESLHLQIDVNNHYKMTKGKELLFETVCGIYKDDEEVTREYSSIDAGRRKIYMLNDEKNVHIFRIKRAKISSSNSCIYFDHYMLKGN